MIKCIAIDDEPLALRQLRTYIARVPFLELAGEYRNALEASRALEEQSVDLIFCDINMPDLSGIDFVRSLSAEQRPMIVFTTAYSEYAVEGFKLEAIDYLLKPIKESDLRRAVEKQEHLTRAGMGEYSRRIGELVRSQRGAQAFLVYVKDRIIPLKTEDIAYLYSSNEKVAVCTLKGEHFPFDRTLDAVMAQLPEEGFFRANRQFVISREAIADISVWFGNRLSVNLSVEVPEKVVISKARVPEFKRWISGIR